MRGVLPIPIPIPRHLVVHTHTSILAATVPPADPLGKVCGEGARDAPGVATVRRRAAALPALATATGATGATPRVTPGGASATPSASTATTTAGATFALHHTPRYDDV